MKQEKEFSREALAFASLIAVLAFFVVLIFVLNLGYERAYLPISFALSAFASVAIVGLFSAILGGVSFSIGNRVHSGSAGAVFLTLIAFSVFFVALTIPYILS